MDRIDPPFAIPSPRAGAGGPLSKRITMNPPESFLVYAAMSNPQPEQINQPIIIGQGGQAVMVSPTNTLPPPDDSAIAVQTTAQVMSGTVTESVLAATTSAPTSLPTTSPDTTLSATTGAPTTATTAETTFASVTPDLSTTIASSAVISSSTGSASAVSTTAASETNSASASTSSPTSNGSSVSASPSASISASATAISASDPPHPFTRSAPFIFLCVLGSLILIAVLATSLSWMFRRPCFPCCKNFDEDDDDGLSDLVTSFHSHTPSRSSTLRRSAYDDDPETALHRRASAFANDPTQSPFLHSGTSGMWGGLAAGAGAGGAAPSIQVPAPAHLYGGGGPLEVRNGLPEDEATEYPGTPGVVLAGTPRFLGLDGDGLEVPWSRQTSSSSGLVGLGIHSQADSNFTSPYVTAPDSRDYLTSSHPDFPSPPITELDHDTRQRTFDPTLTSPTEGSPPPQRAGTWASNLRNTLFAAISGPKPDEEDRFTRPILPLHRNSTRRRRDDGAFQVIEEKDDIYQFGRDGEQPQSVFLQPSMSASSGSSAGTSMGRGKVPLRGGASERYKRYYARSSSGSSVAGASEWSADDRMPRRLAGRERAKGVKGA